MVLEAYQPRIRFCALAGVARAAHEGADVAGQWNTRLRWLSLVNLGELAEQFANWPQDAAAICKFTRRFGPLTARAAPGESFAFEVAQWVGSQLGYQNLWREISGFRPPGDVIRVCHRLSLVQPDYVTLEESSWMFPARGEGIVYADGYLQYRTSSIGELLVLDLLSCSRERVRICKRPDCPNPYFIAHHLRQTYCSGDCAEWAQRRQKLDWWNREGKRLRPSRAEQLHQKRKEGKQ